MKNNWRKILLGLAVITITGCIFLSAPKISFGAEKQVNTETANSQANPAIAMDGKGNYIVVWQSYEQEEYSASWGIYAQRYDNRGHRVGGEFLVNTVIRGAQQNPAVAMDSAGNFVVVWESNGYDAATYDIFARRFDSNGTPVGGEFLVNTFTTSDQKEASVAMDDAGNFVVAWSSWRGDGDYWGIRARRYASNGNPLSDEFTVNTYTASSQLSPTVAMDADGDFVIAWWSNRESNLSGSEYGIYARLYNSSGTPSGNEFRVQTNSLYDQRSFCCDGCRWKFCDCVGKLSRT